jgi:hypothetical protein
VSVVRLLVGFREDDDDGVALSYPCCCPGPSGRRWRRSTACRRVECKGGDAPSQKRSASLHVRTVPRGVCYLPTGGGTSTPRDFPSLRGEKRRKIFFAKRFFWISPGQGRWCTMQFFEGTGMVISDLNRSS